MALSVKIVNGHAQAPVSDLHLHGLHEKVVVFDVLALLTHFRRLQLYFRRRVASENRVDRDGSAEC